MSALVRTPQARHLECFDIICSSCIAGVQRSLCTHPSASRWRSASLRRLDPRRPVRSACAAQRPCNIRWSQACRSPVKRLIVQEGHSNVAIKQVDENVYFIATEAHQWRADNAQRHWTTVMQKVTCSDMRKLPEVATIEWVRPFNRHLQRLLGLGDAHATKADVVNAMRQEGLLSRFYLDFILILFSFYPDFIQILS